MKKKFGEGEARKRTNLKNEFKETKTRLSFNLAK